MFKTTRCFLIKDFFVDNCFVAEVGFHIPSHMSN